MRARCWVQGLQKLAIQVGLGGLLAGAAPRWLPGAPLTWQLGARLVLTSVSSQLCL